MFKNLWVGMKKRIAKSHYFNEYNSLERFISYYYQSKLVLELNVKNVLEVGVGNGLTSFYLIKNGVKVTTCDINKTLRPDYVADIRELPFSDTEFDLIYAYQVLEHLPFDEFDMVLNELFRVSKKFVVISLPCSSTAFELVLRFPFLNKIFMKNFIDLFFRIPYFFRKFRFDGQHYWELCSKGCSFGVIRRMLRNRFKIIKEVRPVINSYHYFFVLEKK